MIVFWLLIYPGSFLYDTFLVATSNCVYRMLSLCILVYTVQFLESEAPSSGAGGTGDV